MHRPPWERRPWRIDITVGLVLAALFVAVVAARPEWPAVSLQATATSTSVPAPTTSSTRAIPTPAPRDVPTGPHGESVSRISTTDPVVFLTIDDGLVRDPEVVDKIRQARVPVSLFLVESEARAGTGYFAELVAAGATVQSHTRSHADLRTLSAGAQADEICGSTALYRQLFGAAPVLFRPPFGFHDATTRQAAAACGFPTMVLWHATVNDGVLRIQGEREHLLPGDIILMHFRPDLSENLSVVFARLAADGLGVGRLEDYLAGR